MSLQDSVLVALNALVANKLRAFLTLLGIVIGVASVIALMAVGQGSQQAISNQILGLGSNLLFVRPGSTNSGGVRSGSGGAQTLSTSDSTSILNGVSGVTAAAPELDFGTQVLGSGSNTFTRVNAVTPDYFSVLNLTLSEGNYFTDDDVSRSTRVAVLGSSVATQLFPGGSAAGQTIRVAQGRNNVITINVLGVLTSKGGSSSSSSDDRIFMPLTTVQHQISALRGAGNAQPLSQINVQVADKGQMAKIKSDITQLLLSNHRVADPDFTIESQDDLAAAASQSAQTMTILLGAVAGISLLVGGIGIMNIMLVSVTERTREIGIRKAVGARNSDIMMQFLTESLTVTLMGGFLGVATGLGVAQGLNGRDIGGLGNNIQTVISWQSVGISFAVSAVIGLFFGLYPASRASNLRPIEALHHE